MSAPARTWLTAESASSFKRRIVLNVVMLDDAAMPMRRVFAHADIGDQQQIANILANRAQRLLNDAVLVVSIRAHFILFRRNAKQHDAGDARLLGFARNLHRIVDRQVVLARASN